MRRLVDLPGVPADEAVARLTALGVQPAVVRPGRATASGAPRPDRPWLGAEHDALVVDLWGGLDPDTVAAAVGSVRGGGVVVVARPEGDLPVSPGLLAWPFGPEHAGRWFDRRFVERLARIAGPLAPPTRWTPPPGPFASDDQRRAVDALIGSLRRQRRPVVVLADRGRGKSAALGLAIARAIDEGLVREVVVTAWSEDAVRSLVDRLGVDGLPVARGSGRVRFVPIPEVEQDLRSRWSSPSGPGNGVDWLVVDEAAAIPLARLLRWAAVAPRLTLATTVHGYEGTGRAFALRFLPALRARAPHLRELTLTTPARWSPGDPLERWLDDTLLLSAEPRPPVRPSAPRSAPEADHEADHEADNVGDEANHDAGRGREPTAENEVEAEPARWIPARLDRAALAADEPALRDVFGLLVRAHYRTRPSDLRRLIDAPNLEGWAAGSPIAGTALVAAEGGLPAELAERIAAGSARPLGHLVPETLAAHLGRPEAAGLRGLRVVRIAVHEDLRRQGLGRALVDAVVDDARVRGLDWVGSAFGGDPEVLRFWAACGFVLVRVGLRPTATSGHPALVVLRAVRGEAEPLVDALRARLGRDLPALLSDPLRDLDPELALAALRHAPPPPADLDPQDLRELRLLVDGHRRLEWSLRAVRAVVAARLPRLAASAVPEEDARLLVRRVLQGQGWDPLAAELGLHRNEAIRRVRAALAALLR